MIQKLCKLNDSCILRACTSFKEIYVAQNLKFSMSRPNVEKPVTSKKSFLCNCLTFTRPCPKGIDCEFYS